MQVLNDEANNVCRCAWLSHRWPYDESYFHSLDIDVFIQLYSCCKIVHTEVFYFGLIICACMAAFSHVILPLIFFEKCNPVVEIVVD